MDALAVLLAERACEALVHDYANLLDAYDYTGFMELWSENPSLNMLGRTHQGQAAIRSWLDAREPGMICRHLVSNLRIRVLSETEAEGRCYTLAFRAGHALQAPPGPISTPTFLVSYRDSFRLEGARGWRLAHRDVEPDLVGPDQMHALLLAARR